MLKHKRRDMIRILAESNPDEEGSLIRRPTTLELRERELVGERAGAAWVAQHRGLKA